MLWGLSSVFHTVENQNSVGLSLRMRIATHNTHMQTIKYQLLIRRWRQILNFTVVGKNFLFTTFRLYSDNLLQATTVASEAYHDWSGEAAGARLRVIFTLKLLLSQNFCNRPLMRFISFASNIGPAAAVPAGPALTPLNYREVQDLSSTLYMQ